MKMMTTMITREIENVSTNLRPGRLRQIKTNEPIEGEEDELHGEQEDDEEREERG